MQTSEREGSGSEVSPGVMSEAFSECPPVPTKTPAFDLFNLVLSYKRLEIYLEPLKDAGDGVRYLLRWQTPLCSLLTCLSLNILFLTLNKGAWYSVGALMISAPALLGYLQEVCRARLPESELMRKKYHSIRQEDLQKVRLSRPEAMAEVKSFLIQLEAFLTRLCYTCEAAYRVLHWENPVVSSQFYGALLGTVCMLYLLPLCWVLILLNSTLFLGNVEFFRVVSEYRASLQRRMNTKQEECTFESPLLLDAEGKGALLDSTPAPTPTEDLTPGSVEEAEEAEPDEEFKDAIEETHLVVLVSRSAGEVGKGWTGRGGRVAKPAVPHLMGSALARCFCMQVLGLPRGGQDWNELFPQEDDEGTPCPAEDELALQDNGFLSKNEVLRIKVSRLTERLRKRYPTNNFVMKGHIGRMKTSYSGASLWPPSVGAAVTVGTASALGAAPSRYPSPPWGPQAHRVSTLSTQILGDHSSEGDGTSQPRNN
ncbi:protrudin isoform X2 [Heterocephalus glaber]|uniref:Protrudin isoform X2 n=1 Tax=Heterocephalus glaber TaxID=10181 RepID=A0AAX6QTA6_HETGA|nr:protrudin isoform X2 [Heterocephalus glaber]